MKITRNKSGSYKSELKQSIFLLSIHPNSYNFFQRLILFVYTKNLYFYNFRFEFVISLKLQHNYQLASFSRSNHLKLF